MFIRKPDYYRCVIISAFLCAISISVAAQAPRDETQTPITTGMITGRVVNESGQPLPNASVFVRGSQPLFQPRTTTTDTEGNFQVVGLDPVLYGISAFAPAYVTPPRDPDSQPNYYRVGDSVTLNLVKGGVITGSVQSASGEPVVQVSVRAVMVRDAKGQAPRYMAFQTQKTTDDRGIYRLYGLLPGTYVVSTGSRGAFNAFDPYDTDAPTYAPSSTRDTAAEITVRAGEEMSGVDIRYRGEPGRSVSGFVTGSLDPNSTFSSNVTLIQIVNGMPVSSTFSFQPPGGKGYVFYGIADGDYDLVAQSASGPGDVALSEPRRISVKGTDVAGIELAVKPLSSIVGRVALEKSEAAECKNKRQPLFSETLVVARRNDKDPPKDQPRLLSFFAAQGSPTKAGEFQLRNMAPGKYNLGARFFARYWYLRSITREAAAAATGKPGAVKRQTDLARDGLDLKFSERQRDVTFTLTEGAASLRGTIKLGPGEAVPPKLYVHLVPAEKENAEDVLRFFSDEVQADGTFALNNLPPGRYWTVARVAGANESQLETRVRAPGENGLRTQIRRAAEAAKTEIEFKPCQNVTDYSLPHR
jgi:carboxypeptidase family protein